MKIENLKMKDRLDLADRNSNKMFTKTNTSKRLLFHILVYSECLLFFIIFTIHKIMKKFRNPGNILKEKGSLLGVMSPAVYDGTSHQVRVHNTRKF